jgi:hypothetical protein
VLRRLSPLLLMLATSGCPADDPPTTDPPEIIDDDDVADDDTAVDPPPAIRITEVMTNNESGLVDGDGDRVDWLELYNDGPDTVDLDGWGLSDDPGDPFGWQLPAVTLDRGEFLVVYASAKDGAAPAGEIHTSFRLAADGETLTLTHPGGAVADEVAIPPLDEDVSYGWAQQVEAGTAVDEGTVARFTVDLEPGWTATGHDDAHWPEVVLGVGFDGEDVAVDPANLAQGMATEQSSDGYGFTGVQAVDGELSTFSHTGDGDLAPWWSVDLGEDARIDRVDLYNRLDCCAERLYNITVEVLDADGDVVTASDLLNPVSEGQTPTSPGDLLTAELGDGVIGRQVRVYKDAVNGASSSEWLSLAEAEVMGSPASPYEGWITTDVQAAMAGVSAEAYLRVPFTVDGEADRVELTVAYDDGFAAWIDGAQALWINADAPPEPHDGSVTETFTIDPDLLSPGDHLLALQGLNVAADDDDFLLRPDLSWQRIETGGRAWFVQPTPGAPNGVGVAGFTAEPTAEPPRGFFEAPQQVSLTCATPDATLVYTLDGSAPTLDHGEPVASGHTLDVDTTAIVRVAAFLEGYEPSAVVTHSYLFLDDVIRQPAAPPGFPTTWDGISQSPADADYEMDPEVVDDPAYHDDLLAGLRAIPTMSIAMDPDDLFGDEAGIYVHSQQRGDDWERSASIELILPDGSTGFQVDAGVRIHGYGWRPHDNTKKHALRLEFRDEYGPRKLEYPLFPDAPVDRFDSIVLRSQGSRGWQDFRDPEQALYVRDAFARDTARDMGKTDGHAVFVHLYLDGLYWGLYNPVERPDARFGEEYFGGDDADYDAINRRTTTNEAIDGDLVAYDEMLALADLDLADPVNYEAIQGYLDLDDQIDYMLIHQYTANRDGPEQFSHNNMRGIRRRETGAQFRFFVWDMEYSLWYADDHINVDVDVAGAVSHVYAALRANPDFRQRYADRASEHLFDGGALTYEACLARFEARADEVFDAVVAESARWGDTDRETPYTRDVEWMDEYTRLVEEFFPYRTEVLIEQLSEAELLVP